MQRMCEELRDGGTKAMRERENGEERQKWNLFEKSNTCLWLTLADMHAYANLGTNKQNKNSDWGASMCAHRKTYWAIGRAKGWKIRWIYRAQTLSLPLYASWCAGRARYSSFCLLADHKHARNVRMNRWSYSGRKGNRIWLTKNKIKANGSQAVEMSCGSRQISAGVISAPQVGCIEEELLFSPERLERRRKRRERERGGPESKVSKINM